MSAIQQQIDSFHQFATEYAESNTSVSIDELFDTWKAQNESSDVAREDLLAVQAAIRDMESGDRGMPARKHLTKVREKYGLRMNE